MESSSMVNSAWQYGVLGIAVLVFGWVIHHLFNRYETRERVLTDERKLLREAAAKLSHDHAVDREAQRANHEAALRGLSQAYAEALRDDRDAMQAREDQIRKEFAELMESVATESSKMAAELTAVLNKIYDRFISPRPRGR